MNGRYKAYLYHDDVMGEYCLAWGKTPGEAKYEISNETGIDFTQIHVRRASWADKYGREEDIPPEVWLKNGFELYCVNCGALVGEEEAVVSEGDAYCKHCWEERADDRERNAL